MRRALGFWLLCAVAGGGASCRAIAGVEDLPNVPGGDASSATPDSSSPPGPLSNDGGSDSSNDGGSDSSNDGGSGSSDDVANDSGGDAGSDSSNDGGDGSSTEAASDSGTDAGDASNEASTCPPGLTLCSGACVDPAISFANCGGCTKACATGDVCTKGKCAAPTGSWQMFGSDAQHTGANLSETGVPPAIASWATPVGAGVVLSPATVEGGRVFTSYTSSSQKVQGMVALSVSDGSPVWTYDFANFGVSSVGHPSVVGGTVYLQTNHASSVSSSALWAIDAVRGKQSWSAPFDSQNEFFWAPLVVGGSIYVDGGLHGGLYGFAVASGTQIFFDGSVGQYDSWSPGYYGNAVYTFVNGFIVEHDPTTGSAIWSTGLPGTPNAVSLNTAPVFGPTLGYVIAPPRIFAFDPANHTPLIAWSKLDDYAGTPAVSGGAVYALSGRTLHVLDSASGSLLWSFAGDSALTKPPVIANGYAYVSSDSNVYAVDLKTHSSVWTAHVGGWLSVASGRLLVAGADGVLHGFVLTPPPT